MIVLDTHVLVWWVNNGDRLSDSAGATIKRELNRDTGQILISAISAWEIAMLVEKGRLVLTMDVSAWLKTVAEIESIRFAPIDQEIAVRSVHLPGSFHADPADRMIVALARHYSAPVVTADAKIRNYKHVKTIWQE